MRKAKSKVCISIIRVCAPNWYGCDSYFFKILLIVTGKNIQVFQFDVEPTSIHKNQMKISYQKKGDLLSKLYPLNLPKSNIPRLISYNSSTISVLRINNLDVTLEKMVKMSNIKKVIVDKNYVYAFSHDDELTCLKLREIGRNNDVNLTFESRCIKYELEVS